MDYLIMKISDIKAENKRGKNVRHSKTSKLTKIQNEQI